MTPVAFHQDLAARNLIFDDNGDPWVIDWELARDTAGVPKMPVPKGVNGLLSLSKTRHRYCAVGRGDDTKSQS